MGMISKLLIIFVALEHFCFLYLEMFLWTTKGKDIFKSIDPDLFEKSKVMAANQGLYNGFLGAGLIWSLLIADPLWATRISCFFLICIIVAGVFGALTAQKTIFFVQALPAILALLTLFLI